MITHVCYSEGRRVATVSLSKKRWIICWHSRQDSRERIANLTAAKQWIARLLDGKKIEWRKEESC